MRIEEERKIVTLMIKLYYKKYPNPTEEADLLAYVNLRLDKCPFGNRKTFCSNCKVHCYKKDMQAKIKRVMRYAGPRMLLYHPLVAIKHLKESRKEKRQNGQKQVA